MTNNTNKTSLKFLLGIPVLLLILSLFLIRNTNNAFSSNDNINPYLNNLPDTYTKALNSAKEVDSTFFCSVTENSAIRELFIFKTSPSPFDVKENFTIELYPSEIKHLKGYTDFLTFDLARDAVVFNYNNKAYAVFKMPLPIINVKKIVIKQNNKNSAKEPWVALLEKPFNDLDSKVIPNLKPTSKESEPYLPNPNASLFTQILKDNNIKVLPSFYSTRNDTLLKTSENLVNYCTSNNETIGKVNQQALFWKRINAKNAALKDLIKFEGTNAKKAKQLLEDFASKASTLGEVFNIKKLATLNALRNVFTDNCNDKVYFIYSNEDNLLEPFYTDSNCLWNAPKFIGKSAIDDESYLTNYVEALNEVSNIDYYEKVIRDNMPLKYDLALINSYDTNAIFNYDAIKANQNAIKKSLKPSTGLKVELISADSQKMIFSAYNLTNYPVEVLGLNHLEKKEITSINPLIKLKSGQKDTIIIDLPRSFENLFVSKKKKITGFVMPKHIYELSIRYGIIGLDKARNATIIPHQKDSKVEDDLFRTTTYINNHKSIVVDEQSKVISFSKDSVVISAPLLIPKGYMFKLKPGTIVNILEGGKIISHSPLHFIGLEKSQIKIYSSDARGHGLLVLSDQRKSTLKHVVFDNLRNPTHGNWGVTGAVTFFESPVDLEFVSVKNNKCEDALNIVRTTFTMKQVFISNTQSDAFDGDFVEGSIINCQFDNLGNDAIDVSGSDLVIKNVTISNAGDKGLSAGENSKMTIDGVEISNSAIAVAGKDLSIVNAKNLKILNTKLGFTAFQKKPEFGPSQITVNGISMDGIETKYLIESSSSLFVDNEKIETTQNVKDRMYGVEFGRSSAETRNTPQ